MLVGMPSNGASEGSTEADRRIEKANRSGTASLDLSKLGLSTIPDSLAKLSNLYVLSLSGNPISTIPDSLAQLSNLQHVYLSDTQIDTIPDSLAQLSNLSVR